MKIHQGTVQHLHISGFEDLNPIRVMWEDNAPCGRVTITCYGAAWTGYWSDMRADLRNFFIGSRPEFIRVNLLRNSAPRPASYRREEEVHLERVIVAVQAAFKNSLRSERAQPLEVAA